MTAPRPLRLIGVPVAAILLVGFFIHLGFPYDRLADKLTAAAAEALGARIAVREVRPGLQLAGPGLEAHDVQATWEGGPTVRLERAMLRPAWSLAWLRGRPALHAEARTGSLHLPGIPLPVPYERWSGELVFGGDAFMEVRSLSLEGPAFAAEVTGTVGPALQLEVELSPRAPALRSALQQAGLEPSRDDRLHLQITGTPDAPIMR